MHQLTGSPVLGPLLDLRGREEELRGRSGHLRRAFTVVAMRRANDEGVPQRTVEVVVDPGENHAVARHVHDVRRHCSVERVDLVVADHLVEATQRPNRSDVSIGGHAHRRHAPPLQRPGESDRRLARGAGHQHLACPEVTVVGEEVVDQKRRDEQPAQQLDLRFACTVVERIESNIVELAIRGSVGGPVRACIAHTVAATFGQHHVLAGHREETEVPSARVDVRMCRFDDLAVAHHGDSPPLPLTDREEIEVPEEGAGGRVRDVVRSERELVDPEPHLAGLQWNRSLLHEPCLVQRVGVDLEVEVHPVHAHDPRANRAAKVSVRTSTALARVRPWS